MDEHRRPENLLGVLLDAYWTSLAHDPLPALLLTGLLSLAAVSYTHLTLPTKA